jgi:hypothetical protein
LGLAGGAQQLGQRLALDVLHDQKALAAFDEDIERWNDVQVAHARSDASFVYEHGRELGLM